jgi:hypothetical protein
MGTDALIAKIPSDAQSGYLDRGNIPVRLFDSFKPNVSHGIKADLIVAITDKRHRRVDGSPDGIQDISLCEELRFVRPQIIAKEIVKVRVPAIKGLRAIMVRKNFKNPTPD